MCRISSKKKVVKRKELRKWQQVRSLRGAKGIILKLDKVAPFEVDQKLDRLGKQKKSLLGVGNRRGA